jgi:hypothetical protein
MFQININKNGFHIGTTGDAYSTREEAEARADHLRTQSASARESYSVTRIKSGI